MNRFEAIVIEWLPWVAAAVGFAAIMAAVLHA